MPIKKDWSRLLQPVLLPLAFGVGIGSFILVADGKTKKTPSKPAPDAPPPSILMIGDSLSCGKFGEAIQMHLALKHRVSAYASCGSSPEHWLATEPDFITKCGYRQRTTDSDIFTDWVNGRAPRPTRTPKLADLIRKHKPTMLVVQLGTNWMDRNLSDDQMNDYLGRFVDEERRRGPGGGSPARRKGGEGRPTARDRTGGGGRGEAGGPQSGAGHRGGAGGPGGGEPPPARRRAGTTGDE